MEKKSDKIIVAAKTAVAKTSQMGLILAKIWSKLTHYQKLKPQCHRPKSCDGGKIKSLGDKIKRLYLDGRSEREHLEQWFSTWGSRPPWGSSGIFLGVVRAFGVLTMYQHCCFDYASGFITQ